jgi:hypothetical protein
VYAPFIEAVKLFFSRAEHEGRPVPVVFAAPDRAYEEMARVTARRTQGGGEDGGDPMPRARKPAAPTLTQPTFGPKPAKKPTSELTTQTAEDRPTPVPFISVWMPPAKFAPARFSPNTIRGYQKDLKTGTALSVRWPRPVDFEVQVDLWCGSAGGHNIAQEIEGQIELQFTAESVYLPIDWTDERWYRPPFNVLAHAKTLGRTRVRLVTEGWADNSEAEGEGAKEVRRTWTGRLEASLPYRPSVGRIVRSTVLDIYDNTDPSNPVLLAEGDAGSED